MTAVNGRGHATDTEALRQEIRRTRAELGETVQALAAKADVKARVRQSASDARDKIRARANGAVGRMRSGTGAPRTGPREPGSTIRENPVPMVAVAGAAMAAIAVILLVIRSRRRS